MLKVMADIGDALFGKKEEPTTPAAAKVVTDWIDDARTDQFTGLLLALGMRSVMTDCFECEVVDCEHYLDEVYAGRPSFFSARELLLAKYPDTAGAKYLVPKTKWWPRVAALRAIADMMREAAGEPVRVAHLYRPEPYNSKCGSESVNHVHCCAIDLDFSSVISRDRALLCAEKLWRSPVNLGMGLGVGSRRIHVDIFSPESSKRHGQPRWWVYSSASKGGETPSPYKGPTR